MKTLLEYGAPLRLGVARTVIPDPGRSLGGGLRTVTDQHTILLQRGPGRLSRAECAFYKLQHVHWAM